MRQDRERCFAAIDIGTNTIRSLVVAVAPGGRYRVLDDERASVRLGQGMSARGKISRARVERALEALKRMKSIAEGRGVEKITVVATSALRKASNREEFVLRVEREAGLRVKVISGAEEARLAFESVRRSFDLSGKRVVVVDIGGGSTEVIFAAESHIEQIHSLEVGAVGLTEEYLKSDPVKPGESRALRRFLRHSFDLEFRGKPFEPQLLIASGGTASALAQTAMALRGESYSQTHGYVLSHADVEHALDALLSQPIAARRALAGLSADRADIVAAGVAILNELMARFEVGHLMVSARGLRDGLIARIARRAWGSREPHAAPTRLESALAFAKSCRFEEAHCRHVARLALEIFDRVSPALSLGTDTREWLHVASLLHDVGYYISYARHHKHSYHLILHSDLNGFTPRETEIIANVARYHRRALPKKSHENFARLPREDRRIVVALSAILRVADGLDRSHAQVVDSIDCRVRDGETVLTVRARREAAPEVWTAREKSALLEKISGARVRFRTVAGAKGAGTRSPRARPARSIRTAVAKRSARR